MKWDGVFMKYFLLIFLFGVYVKADLCGPSWLNSARDRDVVRLIQEGHDVDQTCNEYNDRPLHIVLMLAPFNFGMVRALVDAGADLFAENKAGDSPFDLAQENVRVANRALSDVEKAQYDSNEMASLAYRQAQQEYGPIRLIWRHIQMKARIYGVH